MSVINFKRVCTLGEVGLVWTPGNLVRLIHLCFSFLNFALHYSLRTIENLAWLKNETSNQTVCRVTVYTKCTVHCSQCLCERNNLVNICVNTGKDCTLQATWITDFKCRVICPLIWSYSSTFICTIFCTIHRRVNRQMETTSPFNKPQHCWI